MEQDRKSGRPLAYEAAGARAESPWGKASLVCGIVGTACLSAALTISHVVGRPRVVGTGLIIPAGYETAKLFIACFLVLGAGGLALGMITGAYGLAQRRRSRRLALVGLIVSVSPLPILAVMR